MLIKKPLHFLMMFGHCGIDWLHSLLDSHQQILIMPGFSFYRSWKIINADDAQNAEEMCSIWRTYIEKYKKMQVKRRRLFYNTQESERFYPKFYELLESGGIGHVNVFWAIHEAYAYAKQVDLSGIRIVVAQEHLPFHFERILSEFPQTKILMIIRDPRAAIAGSFHRLTTPNGCLSDYYFNLVTEVVLQAQNIWKKYHINLGERLKIVKNEDLHAALEKHMRDIANWLGVDFSESMLHCTFSGIKWVGESSYISKEEQYPEPLDTYYLPENIKRRWMNELNHREIVMIEFLTNDLMKKFRYKRIIEDTLISRVKGIVIFLLPHRGLFRRWLKSYPDLEEFEGVSRRLARLGKGVQGRIWKILPRPIQFASIVMYSILLRIRIYFFPGERGRRYV